MRVRMPLVAFLAAVLVSGVAPASAVEAPLSRPSFERAVEEGRSCKRIDTSGPYVIVKRGTEPFLASLLDDLLETYLAEEVSDSFVTVRLGTPYTRVRQAACEAKLFGEPFDAQAAWESARASATVTLTIETKTVSKPTLPMTVDMEEKYGTEPVTLLSAGPVPVEVALRRGERDGATIVPPVRELGFEYEFPASALQGEGPFFLIVHTEAPDGQAALKLRPSVLRKP